MGRRPKNANSVSQTANNTQSLLNIDELVENTETSSVAVEEINEAETTDTAEKSETVIVDENPETENEKKVKEEKRKAMQKIIERRRGNFSSLFEQQLAARRGQAAPPKRSFEAELALRRRKNQ